jgi:hypothetical protein
VGGRLCYFVILGENVREFKNILVSEKLKKKKKISP